MSKTLNKQETNIENIYNLTSMQEGLLFHYIQNKTNDPYLLQLSIKLEGEIDIECLRKSYKKLLTDYEILRSIIAYKNLKKPRFIILKNRDGDFNHEILKNTDKNEINKYLKNDWNRGFILDQDNLIRLSILELNKNSFILVLTAHHIIMDGWSLNLILKNLLSIYKNNKKGNEKLNNNIYQYNTFLRWLNNQNYKKAKNYWKNYLNGYENKITIPFLNKKTNSSQYKRKAYDFKISKNNSNMITDYCRNHSVTISNFLQLVWGIILYKYNNTNDIVFPAVISGRPGEIIGIDEMIGIFINTIPLRIKINENDKFHNLVKRVQQDFINGEKYGYISLAEIQKNITNDGNIFDHLFVFENFPLDQSIINENVLQDLGFKITDINTTESTNFPINIIWYPGDELTLKILYDENKIDLTHIEQIAKHIKQIIDNIINNPVKNITDIEIITDEEKKIIINDFNNTDIDFPKDKTIHELFEEQVKNTPNNIAVIYGNKKLTYKELNKKANIIANYLQNNYEIKPDDLVGIILDRSEKMIIAIMGILKSGAAYMPIDPDYPDDRIQLMLKDANPKVLISDKKIYNSININEILENKNINNPKITSSPEKLAYIIYTSGSTGVPKGSLIENKSVVRLVKNTNYIDIKHDDVILQLSNYAFDGSVFDIFGSLLNGAGLVLLNKNEVIDINKLADIISFHKVTVFFITTALFNTLVNTRLECLKGVRKILFGGEQCSPFHIDMAFDFLKSNKLIHVYGPTENTVFTSYFNINKKIEKNVISYPIGKPISNTKIYIVNQNNKLSPIGIPGELCISGSGLSRGYSNRPELTSEKFIDHPFIDGEKMYKTGDLARWLPDGNIEFLGRIDRQVKIRGYRIELGEIENELLKYDFIKEAIVLPITNKVGEKSLCAYYTTNNDSNQEKLLNKYINIENINQSIKDYLKLRLPAYMIPSYILEINKIPLTPNGKVDRNSLPDVKNILENNYVYTAPRNETEKKLVKIWEEILGVNRIGINNNFFELGGHSLKAISLISHINKVFNINIEISEIFSNQTIKDLADIIKNSSFIEFRKIKPVEKKEYYPVTSPQKRLYSLQRDENETAYNMPYIFMFKGKLNIDKFKTAFNKIIEKHEAFRTSFHLIDDKIIQKINDNVNFDIDIIDLNNSVKNEKEIIENFVQSFDLSKAPLLRVKLLKKEINEYLMLIDMHHIIADGTSLGVLIKDFTQVYKGQKIKELKIQFKDYAVWQDNEQFKNKLLMQRNYWLSKFEDEIPVLNFPTDFPRPAVQNFEGNRISFEIDEKLTSKIYEICMKNDVTLYMFLFSVYSILLSKYSRQEDIVVGSGVSGRNHPEIEGIVGMFVNTLAVRCKPDGEKKFIDYLMEIKKLSIEMYENQDYPFEDLVEQLIEERDPSRNPIFDAMFIVQNMKLGQLNMEDVQILPYDSKYQTSKFDLFMDVWENEKKIQYNIEYCIKLFKEKTIKRIGEHFEQLLRNVLTDFENKIKNINIITNEEKTTILEIFNNTKTNYPKDKTIAELFEEHAEKNPDNIAVVYKDKKLTYKELNDMSNSIAHVIKEKKIIEGELIGLLTDRSLEMIIGILGILKSGGAYLPIDTGYPLERINYMLEDSNCKLLLSCNKYDQVKSLNIDIIDLEKKENYTDIKNNLNHKCKNNSLAYVMYTSGSTGKPKGVMVEHQNVIRLVKNTNYVDFNKNDKILLTGAPVFDATTFEIWGALLNGLELYLIDENEIINSDELENALKKNEISIMWLTAPLFNQLSEQNPFMFSSLKQLVVGGDILSCKHINLVMKNNKKLRIINGYGPTENTTFSVCFKIDKKYKNNIPIGVPISNSSAIILNKYNKLQPIGVPGELCLSGDGLARGYLNRPELTKEKFVENPFIPGKKMYKTGDLARWLEDGNIEFLGRIDEQVKIRGFRVEPGEIESVINQHNKVKNNLVIIKEGKNGEKNLVSYVIPQTNIEDKKDINDVKDEQIKEWQILFDDNYKGSEDIKDKNFNIAGWNSSYTDSPIETEAMTEWVEYTVDNIIKYKPKKVLEIGSGTGLLLFRIAKNTEEYLGTDLSGTAVNYVNEVLNKIDKNNKIYKNVEVREQEASDFSGIKQDYYDAVIINSVVQYFPDMDYLIKVIKGAASSVKQGGKIFIGDVRNLNLLETFHSSVALYKCKGEKNKDEIRDEIFRNMSQETELVIDPDFFKVIKNKIIDISNAEIKYKRGTYNNELTKYRYDVVLHVKEKPITVENNIKKHWVKDNLNLENISRIIKEQNIELLEILDVPNPRLIKDIKDFRSFNSEDNIIMSKNHRGEYPEEFYKTFGDDYDVSIHYAGKGKDEFYNVVLVSKNMNKKYGNIKLSFEENFVNSKNNWNSYGNNPIKTKVIGNLGLSIREYLKLRLPDYMIPSYILLIDEIPLTKNGKVDRKSLPDPKSILGNKSEYAAPRNNIENKLVKIWEEVLGVDRIGINDNFFELGGHSLKAISLISHINKLFNINIEVSEIFSNQTIKALTKVIEKSSYVEFRKIKSVERRNYYPITSPQKRIYSLQRNIESIVYNMPCFFTLKGQLDINKFKEAFQKIIKKHEAFRTGFDIVNGEIVQIVSDSIVFKIEIIDLQKTEKEEELLIKDFVKPFDLSKAPLLRVKLLRKRENEHIMLIDMHHIISDGTTMGILLRDFAKAYKGDDLEELKIQYKDYAVWQQDKFYKNMLDKERKYWLSKFNDEIPVLNLPTDYKRATIQSFEGDHLSFEIDDKLTSKIYQICRESDATLYMFLFSVFSILLSKYSAQEDIIVGTSVSGRNHAEIEGIAGMFINTLAVRSNPEGEKKFKDYLTEVKDILLEMYENQDYPFEDLIEQLSVKRDVSRNPIFDVMFTVQNMEIGKLEIGDINLIPYDIENRTSKFDLLFEVWEGENNIKCSIEYCTKLFKKETIKRIKLYFEQLIKNIIIDIEKKIKDLNIITAEEKNIIHKIYNDTTANYPGKKTIHRIFEEQVKKTPNKTAVAYNESSLTYKELNAKANQLARYLREKGVTEEDIVGVLADRSIEMIIGILGILKAGGAYLPINPEYPKERINYMIEDSNAKLVLTKSNLFDKNEIKTDIIYLDDNKTLSYDESNLEIITNAESLCYIIYTSGTTGKPKGVMIEHKNVVRLLFNDKNLFNFSDQDTWTMFHSYCFDFSVWEMYGALLYGGKLVIVPKCVTIDPGKYLQLLKKEKVTILNQIPSAFYNLINEELKDTDKNLNLRYIIFGGEALKPGNLKKWHQKYPEIKLINMYGITETTVHVTYKEIKNTDIDLNISNIGKPIPTLSVYIMDKNMNLQPIGIPGEIYVGGDGVGRGYLNKPELTKDKFIKNPFAPGKRMYRSGDLARWLPDGNIEYLGRIDKQVKIRGFRIELGEIESRLLTYKSIKNTAVTVREDNNKNNYLCAYIISDTNLSIKEIKTYLSKTLPDYMIPSYFVFIDNMPLTSSGKIDRKKLPLPDGEITTGVEYITPRNDLEIKLAKIWMKELNLEKIGIDDNFFDLGGHSLKAINLISRIHKELNAEINIIDIFENQTIRLLGEKINKINKQTYSSIKKEDPNKEYYEISSAQKRLYLLNQLEGINTSYNMPTSLIIEGKIDKNRFNKAIKKLIDRHESFRTSFHLVDGKPLQKVEQNVDFEIKHIKTDENKIDNIIKDFVNPFNLNKAPLIRAVLAELNKQRHILIFDMHHIISDGTSINIIINDFINFYNDKKLPELKIQYKDFSSWQNELLKSDYIKKQEKYWIHLFSNEIPVLNMPTDYHRPKIQSFEGSKIRFEIDKELTSKINLSTREHDCTLYMLLLSAFNILLSKYSHQEDIIIGSPVAGRNHNDLKNIIGMFVNTLPIRNYPKSELKIRDFIKQVKKNTLNAFNNQDYQFEDLIEKVEINRDISRNPLFDVMFVLQNMEISPLEINNLLFKPYNLENNISKFDLILNSYEENEQLYFDLEYCTKLFKQKTIDKMKNHYLNILSEIINYPDKKISDIDILNITEKEQIINTFNNTESKYENNKTIHELFEEQVLRTPDKIAVEYNRKQLTYKQLNEKSNQLARLLRKKGIKQNSIIGLMYERSLEMIIGIIGILKSGNAYLPIDPSYPEKRINYMIKDSNIEILITNKDLKNNEDLNIDIINISNESLFSNIKNENLNYNSKSSDLLYMIYTSGSTGNPKGVLLTHKNLVNLLTYQYKNIPIDFKNSNILQFASLSFDVSFQEIFTTLLQGSKLYLIDENLKFNIDSLFKFIKENQINIVFFPPVFIKAIFTSNNYINIFPKSIKHIITAGEQLIIIDRLKKYLQENNIYLHNHYGPSETHVVTTYTVNHLNNNIMELPPIGKPISNTKIYILDKNMNIVPIGVYGELYISGDCVGMGYYQRDDLTSKKFIKDPFNKDKKMYKTGDLARWLPDGNIEFMGRIDHQVKIRGFRVELGEIESKLLQIENIKEAAIINKLDKYDNNVLYAFYLSEKEIDLNIIKNNLSEYFPEYMIPSFFIRLKEFPFLSSGKINRKLLKTKCKNTNKTQNSYTPPNNEIEKILVKIWQDILNNQKIGIDDNFFELGGHSIKAIQIIAKLNEQNYQINISDIFLYSTIRKLAIYIKNKKEKHNLINNIEDAKLLLNELLNTSVDYIKYNCNNKTINILFIDKHILLEKEKYIHEIIIKNISKKIYPHYILPTTDIKTEKKLELHLKQFSTQVEKKLKESITNQTNDYNNSILNTEIKNKFEISAVQKGHLSLQSQLSGAVILVDDYIEIDIMNRAFLSIIKNQGLLRSILSKNKDFWVEYRLPDKLNIPFIDLSNYFVKDKTLLKLVQELIQKDMSENKLLYKVLLIKKNLKEHYFILSINHSIYDRTSCDIIKRDLLRNYNLIKNNKKIENENIISYEKYISQINKGPQNITQDELITLYNLNEYSINKKQVEMIIKNHQSDILNFYNFKINFKKLNITEEKSWIYSFIFINLFLQKYLNIREIPLRIVYHGRKYEEKDYYNTIGEFLDLVPLLINPDLNSSIIKEYVTQRINKTSHFNINFMNLLLNKSFSKKWKKCIDLIKPEKIDPNDMMILFNFIGKMDEKELEASDEILKRIVKQKKKGNDLIQHKVSSIFFHVSYTSKDIHISFVNSLDLNNENIQNIFDEIINNKLLI